MLGIERGPPLAGPMQATSSPLVGKAGPPVLDGLPLVDAHTHVPLLPTLNEAWRHWAYNFGRPGIVEDVWGKDGVPSPQRLEEIIVAV